MKTSGTFLSCRNTEWSEMSGAIDGDLLADSKLEPEAHPMWTALHYWWREAHSFWSSRVPCDRETMSQWLSVEKSVVRGVVNTLIKQWREPTCWKPEEKKCALGSNATGGLLGSYESGKKEKYNAIGAEEEHCRIGSNQQFTYCAKKYMAFIITV